jgi:uncharacterized protein (TIGR01777 family)
MTDETFTLTTRIARPAADVFAWHERPGALLRLCPPWEKIELVSSQGGIRDGARVVIRTRVGPVWSQWRMEHRDYIEGRQFRDVMVEGPFAKWEHLHAITADGPSGCFLTDTVTYRLPLRWVGRALGAGFVRRKLAQTFRWRQDVTKADLESTAGDGAGPKMKILVAGVSGMLGRALVPLLQTQGHTVVRLVRRAARTEEEVTWNPATGELATAQIEGVDAVVNLSGENVAAGRWTTARRERIRRSRVDATRTLVTMLARLSRKPAVLVNASAVGFYGDRGDEELTEASAAGPGFLAGVVQDWEAEAGKVSALGIREVRLRLGVVLSPAGGALAKMLPLFRAGLGGRLGSGRQWMSWISVDDAAGVLYHALANPQLSGAVNGVAPEPVTNAGFTTTLAAVLHRPAILPVPAAGLRGVFGQMADETVLVSAKVVPGKLAATGYVFRWPQLARALRHVLGLNG